MWTACLEGEADLFARQVYHAQAIRIGRSLEMTDIVNYERPAQFKHQSACVDVRKCVCMCACVCVCVCVRNAHMHTALIVGADLNTY